MSSLLLSASARTILLSHGPYRLYPDDVIVCSQCYRNPQGEQMRVAVCRGERQQSVIKVSVDGDAYLWAAALWSAAWLNSLPRGHGGDEPDIETDIVPDDQSVLQAVGMPASRISAAVLVNRAMKESLSLLDSRQ